MTTKSIHSTCPPPPNRGTHDVTDIRSDGFSVSRTYHSYHSEELLHTAGDHRGVDDTHHRDQLLNGGDGGVLPSLPHACLQQLRRSIFDKQE
jgi:hypothetical protein